MLTSPDAAVVGARQCVFVWDWIRQRLLAARLLVPEILNRARHQLERLINIIKGCCSPVCIPENALEQLFRELVLVGVPWSIGRGGDGTNWRPGCARVREGRWNQRGALGHHHQPSRSVESRRFKLSGRLT